MLLEREELGHHVNVVTFAWRELTVRGATHLSGGRFGNEGNEERPILI